MERRCFLKRLAMAGAGLMGLTGQAMANATRAASGNRSDKKPNIILL